MVFTDRHLEVRVNPASVDRQLQEAMSDYALALAELTYSEQMMKQWAHSATVLDTYEKRRNYALEKIERIPKTFMNIVFCLNPEILPWNEVKEDDEDGA